MSRGIEAAFWGTLGRVPELKTSKAGKLYCSVGVAVVSGKTKDKKDIVQWVRVTCFGKDADTIVGSCQKGDRVYCEGILTLNAWTSEGGEARTGLNLAAWKMEKVVAIGKAREKCDDAMVGGMP